MIIMAESLLEDKPFKHLEKGSGAVEYRVLKGFLSTAVHWGVVCLEGEAIWFSHVAHL